MTENFPNLVKEIDIHVQEAQRVPNKMKIKRPTSRHIVIKITKVKYQNRILKAARGKQLVIYKEAPIKLSTDLSKEALQARRGWQEIYKVIKRKDLQPRLFYPDELSFRIEGQMKILSLIHISEPTRQPSSSRMPSSA